MDIRHCRWYWCMAGLTSRSSTFKVIVVYPLFIAGHDTMQKNLFLFCPWSSCSHVTRRRSTFLGFNSYSTQCPCFWIIPCTFKRFECSTMGVGRQSRRVCFGAKPDKGFLDKKISPYPEVVRGRERELTTRPRAEAVGGWTRERSCGWTREAVGGWTGERRVAAGDHGGQLVAGEQRGVGSWTGFSCLPRSYSCVGKEMCVTPSATSWSPAG